MNELDAIAWAQEAGWEAGSRAGPYSPPIAWGICPDADDAYITAYWAAFSQEPWIRIDQQRTAP